jgi:hypothetical protein
MAPKMPGKRRPKQIIDHREALRLRVAQLLEESRARVRAAHAGGVPDQNIELWVAIYVLWADELRNVAVRAQAKLAAKGISGSPMDRPFGAIAAHAFEPRDQQQVARVRHIGAALDYLHRRHASDAVVRERLATEGFRRLAVLGEMDSDDRPVAAPPAGGEERRATEADRQASGGDDSARNTELLLELIAVLRRGTTFHRA